MPIIIAFSVLSLFAQPRRIKKGTIMFLIIHLFRFAVFSEVLAVF